MGTVASLTKRNILVYVKNGGAVFFSMLSVFIIFLLYILFLAKMNIDGVLETVRIDRELAAYLVNSWVMSGIIVVNSVTVTLGVIGTMVEDEDENRIQAFLVSPASRSKLTLGYVMSAFIIGNINCTIVFILSQIFIAADGGSILSFAQIAKVLGIIVASVFSSTCFVFFLVSFMRTMRSFTTVCTIIGSTIGLIAGIYVPVGMLPEAVRKFIKFLPVFQNSSLMRSVFMEKPVAAVFKGAPSQLVSGYMESMGVKISFSGEAISDGIKTVIVIASGIVFLALSMLVMRKRRLRGG